MQQYVPHDWLNGRIAPKAHVRPFYSLLCTYFPNCKTVRRHGLLQPWNYCYFIYDRYSLVTEKKMTRPQAEREKFRKCTMRFAPSFWTRIKYTEGGKLLKNRRHSLILFFFFFFFFSDKALSNPRHWSTQFYRNTPNYSL